MSRPHLVDGWRIDVTVRPGVPRILARAACARTVAAALAAAEAPAGSSLSVILTDDAELADLNVTHLGHAGPTDVLSFPLLPASAFPMHPGSAPTAPLGGAAGAPGAAAVAFVLPPRARVHLGDIVVSVERAIEQAREGRGGQTNDVRWAASSELRLLLTHGTLHVCGWDHLAPDEERAMRALEGRALALSD